MTLGHDVHGPAGAPAVVLGSSLGTTRAMWDEQLPALAQRFRVIRYDHLGHGESSVPPGPYSVPQLADELRDLLTGLGVERAHLGGLSLGGIVAMQLAATAPGLVESMVLLCTGAHLPPAQGWLDRAATVRTHGTGAVVDGAAERWFTPAFATSSRARQLLGDLRDVPPEGYAGCCEAIAGSDLRPALGGIHAPTMVIAGAVDPATPPAMGEEIVRGVAGPAQLEVLPAAAHLSSVERAEEVTSLMLEHFSRQH